MKKNEERKKKEIAAGLAVIAVLVIILIAIKAIKSGRNDEEEDFLAEISSLTTDEVKEMRIEEAVDEVIKEFDNFGIIETDGYINLRSEPDELDMSNIIGRLDNGAGVDIIEELDGWTLVESGSLTGYCSSQYIVTGERARELALPNVFARVVIDTDVLNIREEPSTDTDNIIGKARYGERYVLITSDGEWARVEATDYDMQETEGYINIADGNAFVKTCLNVAKKLDLRMMAATQYDNMVLSATEGYINIRKEPKSGGIDNIIGKFAEGNGGELLETVKGDDGYTWYKIKSGGITGYVRGDYCLIGDSAINASLPYARLTAYVNVDALNVRTGPSLEAKVWTSITKNQAYDVIDQLDGWVEIELDSGDNDEDGADRAFVSTRDNNVEVRYGLQEAIEYYPAVEAANAAAAYRNKIVNYACKYVGGKYVWGGTSLSSGVDCSGFTMKVMQQFGISLPRTSRAQAQCGTRVTSATMKPGDLVFYANSSGTIDHVAIYIGNGQVISASSKKTGIRITRWNYRTPVAIRNVIGA